MTKKTAENTLNKIYGIGKITSQRIRMRLALHPKAYASEMHKETLRLLLENMRCKFRLRLLVFSRLLLLIILSSYRGLRLVQKLPKKGRTHANGKTLKRLQKAGKFFPFRMITRQHFDKKKVKPGRNLKNVKILKNIKKNPKISKKVKAKNKARAKAKKKKNKG
jgi:ribosomal protein S13